MESVLCTTSAWVAWGGLVMTTWLGDKLVAEFVNGLPTK